VQMTECKKFRVEGRVQGVWFRESTRKQADRLGIRGYAVNCSDGSVEVLACGGPEAIAELASWLNQGPPMARVHSVTELKCTQECPDRFSTA
jgi:acylphosphatase